jgi:hypothetical protein
MATNSARSFFSRLHLGDISAHRITTQEAPVLSVMVRAGRVPDEAAAKLMAADVAAGRFGQPQRSSVRPNGLSSRCNF